MVRPTGKVNGKGRTLTTNEIKIPDFFELDIHDYVPKMYPRLSILPQYRT